MCLLWEYMVTGFRPRLKLFHMFVIFEVAVESILKKLNYLLFLAKLKNVKFSNTNATLMFDNTYQSV